MGPSRKTRNLLDRDGCRSLPSASASICRMHSRETANVRPTSFSLTALLAHGDEGTDLVMLFFNRQRQWFLRELRASYAHFSEPKSFGGSFLRICLLFFAPPAFVSCPVPYYPFPAVKLQLFLNAISLQMFVHRGG